MEVFGLMGFTIGGGAMAFAIIAWGQIASLRKEFEELRNSLEESGAYRRVR